MEREKKSGNIVLGTLEGEKIHSHMVSLLKELFSDINATVRAYKKFILRELYTLD